MHGPLTDVSEVCVVDGVLSTLLWLWNVLAGAKGESSMALRLTGQMPEHLKAALITSGRAARSKAGTKTWENVPFETTKPGLAVANCVQAFFHSFFNTLIYPRSAGCNTCDVCGVSLKR